MMLIEAVGKLNSVEPLQVRIGVGTGVVVVGDLVGSGEAQERGVVGETPNRRRVGRPGRRAAGEYHPPFGLPACPRGPR